MNYNIETILPGVGVSVFSDASGDAFSGGRGRAENGDHRSGKIHMGPKVKGVGR